MKLKLLLLLLFFTFAVFADWRFWLIRRSSGG